MQSKAKSVKEYLAELPADRRATIEVVRKTILKNLDKDYREEMSYGMIGYVVPHSIFPPGYHCNPKLPLPFVNLASQKNHLSLYMMCLYADSELSKWFDAEWKKHGKKLDKGKACLRFKTADDLALDLIGQTIKKMPAKKWIEIYQKMLATPRKPRPKKSAKS